MLLGSSFERNSCRKLKSKAFFSSFKLLLEYEQQENWRVNFHVCHHETISLTLRCFLFDRIHDFQFFKTPILIICNYLGKLRRHILVSMVWWWFLVCYLFGYLFYLWTVLLIYLALRTTSDYQKTHVILVLTEMMMGVNFVQASVDFSGLILQTTMCAVVATNHLERRLSQSWGLQKWDFFCSFTFLGRRDPPCCLYISLFSIALTSSNGWHTFNATGVYKKIELEGR